MMARAQSPGDLRDFFQEFEDIRSSKRPEEDDEETAKTPDEGEQEAAWLQEAGYGFIVSKFKAGKELTEEEINKFTESMPSNHAAVVKRRVDTLNATLRKKQKHSTKIDVRNIFPEQPHSGTLVIHSQPVDDEEPGTRQLAKRPSTLPRGMKLGSQNGDSNSWIKQKNVHHIGLKYINQSHWKNTSPDNVKDLGQWKSTNPEYVQGQGHWKNSSSSNVKGLGQWKSTNPEYVQDQGHWKNTSVENNEGHWKNTYHDLSKCHILEEKPTFNEMDTEQIQAIPSSSKSLKGVFKYSSLRHENFPESSGDHGFLKRSDSKDSVSPLSSPQRSMSSSCHTLDSLDSGLESSESLLNPEHSSSRDSLDTVDGVSCFPRKGPLKHKVDNLSQYGSSYSPMAETASPLDSPYLTEEESSPTLLAFRKRKSSVTEMPKSPVSPRNEVVHPEWNRNRASKGSFAKNRGGYSMSGLSEEVQSNVQQGVEMLSVQQKGTVQKRWSQLSPISDTDITFEFSIEENAGEAAGVQTDRTVMDRVSSFDLPNFSLVQDKLGLTGVDDISETDIAYVKKLALLELTSMFDTHNITYSRRRTKKRHKENGIFGVPLVTMLEHDQKLKPSMRTPLVFQEIVSYLVKCCLDTEGILRVPGSTSRVKQLRQEFEERFYQGTFIWADDLTANDVATLMKQFLRDLPVPLLTDEYIEAFAQVENLPDKKQQLHALNLLILLLPNVHRDMLSVLLEFLKKIIENSNINKMSLNNVAMIMAPNLFMSPKVRGSNPGKGKATWDLEIRMAANTSNIMKMLIHYKTILWTVPTYLMSLVRRQYELEQLRKNKDKSKMKGLLSKKDKSEVYRKPALKHEADFQEGVIRIQAPNLTKSSTAIQLDTNMTAGDIVSKFRVIQGSQAPSDRNGNGELTNSHHGAIYNDPSNFHSAGDDTFLFEIGGNIGERCLPNNTNVLALYKINPNAEWVIKQHERLKIT